MCPVASKFARPLGLAAVVLLASLGRGGEPAAAQQVSLSGWFHLIWGDARQGFSPEPGPKFVLVDESGRWTELSLDEGVAQPLGGPLALNRKRVRVLGDEVQPGRAEEFPIRAIQVRSLSLESAGAAALSSFAVRGSQPWVSILCRFADSPDLTPHPVSWFETLMGSVYPGLDHYWRELSHGAIDILGSTVVGWYNLPDPRSQYVRDIDGDGSDDLDFSKALGDCADAADPDVFFPDFVGINLMFNQRLDCCAWGGGSTLNRDGLTKGYAVTWMPPWAYNAQHVVGHEMGHGFGLPHSSGPYTATYDSNWDVMSGGRQCNNRSAEFGCIGPHTISFHKDLLNWIPVDRRFLPATSGTDTITISRLGQAALGGDYLMAQIPIGVSTTHFYTVATRLFGGYDDETPGEAVVIHEVDRTRSRPARVVDSDGDGDPNDEGAMWIVGEIFMDVDNDVLVKVNSTTQSGFTVTVINTKFQTVSVSVVGDGTVRSSPEGIDCPGDCNEIYTVGTVVGLEAIPAAGFVLAGWDGACFGTGSCSFTIDGSAAPSVSAIFTAPLTITTTSLPNGTMGAEYSDSLFATGGTVDKNWEIVTGRLPAGITLQTLTGALSGIPEETGTFNFSARVTAVSLATERDYTIAISAPPVNLEGVLGQLIGTQVTLGETELRYLDLLGNRNGRLDVGDFRAWVGSTAQLAVARGSAEWSRRAGVRATPREVSR